MRISLFFSIFLLTSVLSFSQEIKTVTLYFELDKSILNEESIKQIDSLVKIKNIDSIEIVAYTDYLGIPNYNQKLSEQRSKSVYSYLIKNGIPKNKILICKGMGIYPNSNLYQRKDTSALGIAAHRIAEITYSINAEIQEKSLDTDSIVSFIFHEKELEIGDQIVLENILFYSGTPTFKPESGKTLKELLKIMQEYPRLEIEIQGHICCQYNGKDGYDQVNNDEFLSVNRAKAVYNYLVSEGIDSTRMTYKGFGSSMKRYPYERTPKEEDMNRRVEIKILNK